jgi:EAL domain-containing protein (putative c-di-GMP-specific phosphodiesterase class I)
MIHQFQAVQAAVAPLVPGLRFVFQPIVSIASGFTVRILECLARGPVGSVLERADMLFAWIKNRSLEVEMDRECFTTALAEAARLPDIPVLSLNVHPKSLEDPETARHLLATAEEQGIPPSRLILEIVEQRSTLESFACQDALASLRDAGMRIALDDFGFGHSNLRRLLEIQPDFVKIDRQLVTACDRDPFRRSLLDSLQRLAGSFDAAVIVEGVETDAELDVVRALGIDLVQGFLVSAPRPLESFVAAYSEAG